MLLNILLKLFSPVLGPPWPEGFGRWEHLLCPQVFPLAQTGLYLQTSLRQQPEELGLFALIFQESSVHTAKIRGDAGSLHDSANWHKGTVSLIPHCPTQLQSLSQEMQLEGYWGVFSRLQGYLGKIPKIRLGTCPASVLPRRTGWSAAGLICRGIWRRSGCHWWEAQVPLLVEG